MHVKKSRNITHSAITTFISAINSSLVMFCFSVTRMPFSSRIALQRGSTLSLISTVLMEIGAILVFSLRVARWWATGGCWVIWEKRWMDGSGSCFFFLFFFLLPVLNGRLWFKTPPFYVDPPAALKALKVKSEQCILEILEMACIQNKSAEVL